MRIVISGYYGFSNAGDDAILAASIPLIRSVHPAAQISVVTYPGADLDAVYRSTGLSAVDGSRISHVNQLIETADLLLIGGGGLLQDYLPSDRNTIARPVHNNLTFWMSLAAMARAHGVRSATWFIGIGPLRTELGRENASLVMQMIDVVSVRDESSAALARELGVPDEAIVVGADPVFTLERSPITHGDHPTIGVTIRAWEGIDGWLQPIADALDRVIDERDAEVVLVPFQSGRGGIESDDLVALRLGSRMANKDRRQLAGHDLTPSDIASVLGGCDVVLGMRLHSIILAAVGGVPTVALSYDPKVDEAMTRLGRPDFVTGLDEPSADWIHQRLLAALDESADVDTSQMRQAIEAAVGTVLEAAPAGTAIPSEVGSALVRSLAGGQRSNRSIRERLERELTETRAYLTDRVTELELVRSEFQAFRDSRAVKLAQAAWTARNTASELIDRTRSLVDRNHQPQLEVDTVSIAEIVGRHPDTKGFVVFAPSIDWDVELFQRPQQMALGFARNGYTVLYQVDETYRGDLVDYRRVGERIYEGYLPDERLGELTQIPSPIYMSYVYNYEWGRALPQARRVYEHIDDLEVFEQVHGRSDLERWHRLAITEADVVVGSARDLLRELQIHRPDALLVQNGVDVTHFAESGLPVPDDLAEVARHGVPVVGYYGALAEWFDYGLLAGIAERLPDHAFVLIGPDYDGTLPKSRVLDLPNVHWLGSKPYGSLPAYLERFDVATIPFVVSEVTHSVSPLKLFEYMAGGKPVITPPLRECAQYDTVLIADGPEEWSEMIGIARELSTDPSYVASLRATAAANTWDARVRSILDAL